MPSTPGRAAAVRGRGGLTPALRLHVKRPNPLRGASPPRRAEPPGGDHGAASAVPGGRVRGGGFLARGGGGRGLRPGGRPTAPAARGGGGRAERDGPRAVR